MDARIKVPQPVIDAAGAETMEQIARRLKQHGRGSYINAHEALGIIAEEYDELKDAVRGNDLDEIEGELFDIAVGCIFAVASLRMQRLASEDEDDGHRKKRKKK